MTRPLVEALAPDDIAGVARIHAASFDDVWSADMIRRVLATAGAFGLVARGAARRDLLGFALGRIILDECELLSLAVAAGHRRQGVGAALLDRSLVRAAAAGARSLFLEVGEFNDAARQLYRSRGLVPVGRRRDYYELTGGALMDALTMRRDLVGLRPAAAHADPIAERRTGSA